MSRTADFDPVRVAKRLLRATPFGALATLREGSTNPFCSLVNIGTLPDGSPILLISRLAVHTRNIAADKRVSLLLAEHGVADPLAAARISITGTAEPLTDSAAATARSRYLAAHPSAELFVDFADFSFFRVAIESVHLVGGFGRIFDLRGADVLTNISDAGTLLAAEEGAVAHMNDDHRETMMLYASALCGAAAAADWRCSGLDPEGMDMRSEDGRALRVDFPQRVVTPDALRRSLKELADHARSQSGKPN